MQLRSRASGRRSSWTSVQSALSEASVRRAAGSRGAGLHLLLEPTASPLVLGLLARVRQRYPDCRVHWDAPLTGDDMRRGSAAALFFCKSRQALGYCAWGCFRKIS